MPPGVWLVQGSVLAEGKEMGLLKRGGFNHLKTKRRLLYLKTQFVPRSEHFNLGY